MSSSRITGTPSTDRAAAEAPSSASVRAEPAAPIIPGAPVPTAAPRMRGLREMLHFAFGNRKLIVGLSITLVMLLFAAIGPSLAQHPALEYGGQLSLKPTTHDGYWLGTTLLGQDVYAQFATGVRLAFIVGALGGGIAAIVGMLVGFTAGYRSGIVDEILNMLTNVVLVIPTFALLLVIAAYLKVRGIVTESIFIGLTSWPWAARALRAQTFSLVSRDFVDMARLSARSSWKIIFKEIAPNMSSYLFMMFILLFGGSILIAATLDFIGLGPSNTISLGMMMQLSVQNAALQLHLWWWFVPPGLAIMAIVGSLYVMNVGLDEVFNPKLRAM
jgi:peptide/nickel transport system permease protein